jgi:hypothetical protein
MIAQRSVELLKAAQLVKDEVYFSVSYVDDQRLIPVLKAYEFAGRDLVAGDSGQLYFQTLDPIRRERQRNKSARDDDAGYHVESEEAPRLFEYEQALEELMRCSLRREGVLDLSLTDATLAGHSRRFEARELEPFAKPVGGAELKEGSVYFSVFFVDYDFLIPGMDPYVFVGRDIYPEEPGLYFQDIDSYRRHGRYSIANEGQLTTLVVDSDDNLNHHEYEQALEELMVCSLRRRGNSKVRQS